MSASETLARQSILRLMTGQTDRLTSSLRGVDRPLCLPEEAELLNSLQMAGPHDSRTEASQDAGRNLREVHYLRQP